MRTSIYYPLCQQLTRPGGFWSHAAHSDFCKIINRALRPDCGPSDINGVAHVVVTPAVPGPGVCISECCFFPQPLFVPATPFLTGGSKPVLAVRRDVGFYSFECGNLDAPDCVASGGMCTLSLHGKAYAIHQAYRTSVGV